MHLEQGVILLPRAKGGARPVILSDEAQKILRRPARGAAGKRWVFPNPDGRPYSRIHISRVFRRAARAAGLQDFHFHDLRHHGATMALNAGFTAPIVMALGGWKTERMMRRYAAVTDQTLRAAAEAVSVAASRGSSALRSRQNRRERDPFKVEIAGSNPAGVTLAGTPENSSRPTRGAKVPSPVNLTRPAPRGTNWSRPTSSFRKS